MNWGFFWAALFNAILAGFNVYEHTGSQSAGLATSNVLVFILCAVYIVAAAIESGRG